MAKKLLFYKLKILEIISLRLFFNDTLLTRLPITRNNYFLCFDL